MSGLELIHQDALACNWDAASYFLFSSQVEPLVYYSHLFPAIAVLLLVSLFLFKQRKHLTGKLFIIIALLFSTFAIFDLILWATEKPSVIMFLWSLLTYIEPLIYIATLYLVLVFTKQQDISLRAKMLMGALILPIFIFGPTSLNLTGFSYEDCWRLAIEGPLLYYVYFTELILVGWMIIETVKHLKKETDKDRRKAIKYLLTGALLFLLAFSSGNIFGTLLQSVMGENSWVIGQYGLFGMPIFLGYILYIIVKFKAFHSRVIYAEAINFALWVLLFSLLFIGDIKTARSIILITLILFAILGYQLICGVKRDIKQKEKIENLAKNLKKANDRLEILDKMKSEFVSIASHQLRSPLTAIRGYASMLLEGSYGKLPKKSTEAVERIQESSRYMALSVEDYLNVSRIEAGNMKYEITDFNLKTEAEKVVDETRPAALKKGLLMVYRSDCDGSCAIHADIGKTRQVLNNLIDNAMKYTPKGSITVFAHDDVKKKKMYVTITDTGVGMSKETQEDVFDKFVRAKNANQVNVTGTGLGLFVAKKMVEEMGGKIHIKSEGEGKGSEFTIEFKLLPGSFK